MSFFFVCCQEIPSNIQQLTIKIRLELLFPTWYNIRHHTIKYETIYIQSDQISIIVFPKLQIIGKAFIIKVKKIGLFGILKTDH